MTTITLHRSECSIWSKDPRWQDTPIMRWTAWSFRERPNASSESESFRKLRLASVPVVIEAPAGSVIVGEGKKARFYSVGASRIDAESVHYLASRGEKGMRISDRRLEDSVDDAHFQPMAGLHQD